MTYLPGTAATVTDLPAEDSGTGGAAYVVSSQTPRREGYEFMGWALDYARAVNYTVRHINIETNEDLLEPKTGYGVVGEEITEYALNFDNYIPLQNYETLKLGENENKNIIIFLYYNSFSPID